MKYLDSKQYEFNKASNNGVYIIHGFTNSTFETRALAEYLGDQGFYTNAINLPGHGTTPQDCNRFRYTDWIQYTEQGIAEMSSKCDNTYVVGVSMGSDLALHLSATFPLTAAVFASTVLEFKDYIGPRILTPLLHKLIPFRKKELVDRIKKGFDLIKKKIPNDLDFYLGFDKNLNGFLGTLKFLENWIFEIFKSSF